MKTTLPYSAVGLALMALCLASLPVSANLNNLLEMSEKADQADRQDLQSALEQANSCTQARNFSCSEEQLRKAAKLVNGLRDQQTLATARQNLLNEKARIAEEFRLAEAARLKAEENMRLAQEAEQQRIARAKQAEQAEQDARQSRTNMQGLLAIAGAVAIGSATSGKNFSDVQRRDLVDAWAKDRANAANGVTSNNFGQATDSVKAQLDAAQANAERARQAHERMRLQEAQQQREAQAAAQRQQQARQAQEESRAAQERARLQAAQQQAQQARLAAAPTTTPKQQAALDAIAAARPAEQTVVIPTWQGGGLKTIEPVRTKPMALAANNLSAGQINSNQCGKPGAINECVNTPQTCPAGQSLVNGQCVTPTISCIAPAVMLQGRCVSPSTNADSNGGNGNTNAPPPTQTLPAPVVPSPVVPSPVSTAPAPAPAPAPERLVPAPTTTVSGPPEPAQPITVETRSFGENANLIRMTNISPRTTWYIALTIFNCVNIKEIYCGRQVSVYTLGPGHFADGMVVTEDPKQKFSYEASVELIQSY